MDLESSFIKWIWITWPSNLSHDMSQLQIDGTFCVLNTQTKVHTFLFGEKKWHLKSFSTQTHLEVRAHKSWHYFILLCAFVKKPRYGAATKTDDCGMDKLDSTSLPLCSDYTFIRKPLSLPVQLEIGKIQEFKGLANLILTSRLMVLIFV